LAGSLIGMIAFETVAKAYWFFKAKYFVLLHKCRCLLGCKNW